VIGAIDLAKLACAATLMAMPLLLGFDPASAAAWSAGLGGGLIGAAAILALLAGAEWEREINLGLGLWVALSPYVLGFISDATATWVHLLIGLAVATLATAKVWLTPRRPARHAPRREHATFGI
jgi:hypothetical protein